MRIFLPILATLSLGLFSVGAQAMATWELESYVYSVTQGADRTCGNYGCFQSEAERLDEMVIEQENYLSWYLATCIIAWWLPCGDVYMEFILLDATDNYLHSWAASHGVWLPNH